jgi:hypothetical protein
LGKDRLEESLMVYSDIPDFVSKIILKSMAILQDNRYQSAHEFIVAFDACVEKIPPSAKILEHNALLSHQTQGFEVIEEKMQNIITPVAPFIADIDSRKFENKPETTDVEILLLDRSKSNHVTIRFRLSKNVKQVMIRKSYEKFPKHHLDGTDILCKNVENTYEVLDDVDGAPVFYTIFCQYKNERKALVAREGIRIAL